MICNVFDFAVTLTHAHCVADQTKINIADLAIQSPEKNARLLLCLWL